MKKFFPLKKRTTLFLISFVIIVSAGFASTRASASVLSSLSTGIGSVAATWWNAGRTDVPLGPTVSTDKADYRVGETVQITGSGFGANDVVTLQVTDIGSVFESITASGYGEWTVNADASGNFSSSWLVGPEAINRKMRLTAVGDPSGARAETTFTDAVKVDFRQCANNDSPFVLGQCHWINSIVQSSNARYFEGMSNMQRILFDEIATTTNNAHTMTLSHQATKGGIHAYDFLTSYEQAIKAGADAGVPYVDTQEYTPIDVADATKDEKATINLTLTHARACGPEIGPPNTLGATCTTIRSAGVKANVDLPDDTYVDSNDGSTLQRIQAYEAVYGNRYLRIYANAPVSNATMTIVNHSSPDTGDSDVNYLLSWTSAATSVLVEVAGHLSVTGVDNTGINWGPGQGSSQISGGPYHFNLKLLDGDSLGSQDNQIKGADILIVPPQGAITIRKEAQPEGTKNFSYTTTEPAGQTLVADAFDLDDDGLAGGDPNCSADADNCLQERTFSGLGEGIYTFTEADESGWSESASCTVSGGATHQVNGRVITITITDEQTAAVSCIYANNKDATLTVTKVANPDSSQEFTINGGGVGVPATTNLVDDGAGPGSDSATFTFVDGQFGVKTLNETIPAGWSLASANCIGETDSDVAVNGISVDMQPGDSATCTFTNDKDATLTIVKQANPEGATEFNFTGSGTGVSANFALVDDGGGPGDNDVTFTFQTGAFGTKSVTETVPSGWSLVSATCSGETDGDVDLADISVDMQPGDSATCTFNNSQPDLSIKVEASDTNEVGDPHVFTVTVTQVPNGATPATTANITRSVTPTPDTTNTTTCGAEVSFNGGNVATCTITVNSSVAGVFDVDASVTATIGGVSVSRSTSGTSGPGGNSGATKTYVDARITIALDGVNEVGDPHPFTVTVFEDPGTGEVAAAGETVTLSITSGTATFVTNGLQSITCVTNASGQCTESIASTTPGVVTVSASVGVSVGGLTVNRSTNSTHGSSGPATKRYVDAQIDVTPLNDANEINDDHPFTVTVQQDDGLPSGAPGDAVTGFGPAAGVTVTFSFVTNEAGATFDGDINTCVTAANGTCSVEITGTQAGLVIVDATTTFSVGVVSLTRSTGTGGLNSADAEKVYVDAQIDITPLVDTNPINQEHEFTATVQQDDGLTPPDGDAVDGFGPAPNGTVVTFSFVQNDIGAVFVDDDNTCTTTNGSCIVKINSSSPGVVIVSATTTFSVGGVSLTRTTGTGGLNSANAQKTYVSGVIIVDKVTLPAQDPKLFDFNASWDAGDPPDFQLADQTAPVNSGNLAPGSYSVTEIVPAGWDLTDVTCVGDDNADIDDTATAVVDLDAGETVTCTFTNTKRGHIIVDKVTNPSGDTQSFNFDAGGTGYNDFSLTDAATPNDQEVVPGSYTVSETVPAGWDLTSATCDNGEAPDSIDVGPGETIRCTFTNTKRGKILVDKVTNPAGSSQQFEFDPSYGANFFLTDAAAANDSGLLVPGKYSVAEVNIPTGWDLTSGICNMGETIDDIDVGPGETVTCTFTNTQRGKILVDKVTNPAGSSQSFEFDPSYGDNFFLTDAAAANDSGFLVPGKYSVAEVNVPAGWDLTSATCNMGETIDDIDVGAGETVTCTFTNTQRGKIIVKKETDPDGASQSFAFTANYDGDGFSLSDGQQNDSGFLVPGKYSVAETVPAGWTLTSATCDLGETIGDIDVGAGETVTCTFNNTQLALVRVIKTISGNPITGTETFTFTLRQNATSTATGNILETQVANFINGGTLNFTTFLTPGEDYQICEVVLPGWTSSILSMLGAFVIQTELDGDNSTICFEFTPDTGDVGYPQYVFNVDNTPPPGGDARTIGYWKNWSSCTRGNQRSVLDWVLWSFGRPLFTPFNAMDATRTPPLTDDPDVIDDDEDRYEPGAVLGNFHVGTCEEAFLILSKSPTNSTGKKKRGSPSDPVYNMAAQFLAVKLNIQAGADPRCLDDDPAGSAVSLIAEADALLIALNYDGASHSNPTGPQKTRLNELAAIFDNYNNNGPTCP